MTWFELSSRRTRRRAARRPAIGRCRQHLVIDRDQRRGVLGNIAVGGNDDRDRLADERDFAIRQRKRPAAVEPRSRIRNAHHAALLQHRREVVEREHGDNAGQPARGARIDGADQRVRMRAAHERGRERAGRHDVVDEAGPAAQ